MEDVAFMRSNGSSVQESYLFMIDSRMRDKLAHPEPNQYQIEFNAPFRNVCSFGLIDATIPRTNYSVDDGSNTLVYTLDGDQEILSATVPPGDYNVLQLTDTLNNLLLGGLRVDPASTPYDLTNKVTFSRSTANFALHMAVSSIRTALGFSEKTYAGTPGEHVSQTSYVSPFQETLTKPLTPTTLVRQTFVSEVSGTVSLISVACDPPTASSTLRITAILRHAGTQAEVATAICTPSRSSRGLLQGTPGVLVAGTSYTITLSANEATQIYVATGPSATQTFQTSANGGTSWTSGTKGLQVCMDVVTTPTTAMYSITSPNLVDITGEKLVLVRCPEIEHVMFRSRATEQKMHTGLGFVKMGGLGFREQRSDYFVPFPARVFHPIAKVSRLTIRLENPDGSLYNTRGVDHFLLLMIAYYKVNDTPLHTRPMLNPQYMPDIHSYNNKKWQDDINAGLGVTYARRR